MRILIIILFIFTVFIFKHDYSVLYPNKTKIYQGIVLPSQIQKLNYKNQGKIIFLNDNKLNNRLSPCASSSYNYINQIELQIDRNDINKLNLEQGCKVIKNNKQYNAKITDISKSSINQGKYCLKIKLDDFCEELKEGENVAVELSM